jgi:hypothetical protein
MREVETMPTNGQFIMVWEQEGDIYADTLTWDGQHLTSLALSVELTQELLNSILAGAKDRGLKYFVV